MPVPKGVRIGGRQKGTVNKTTKLLQGRPHELFKLADERTRQILEGKLPCQTCHGSLKTTYILADGSHQHYCSFFKKIPIECAKSLVDDKLHRCDKCCSCEGIGTRVCVSCHKRGLEKLNPDLIWKATLAVRRESVPELRAIEHTGPDGGAIQHAHTIKFVD
jgi:hypothetical protein